MSATTEVEATDRDRARRDRQGGPPLIFPALIFAVLTIAGGVVGGAGPRPDSSPAEVLAYFADNALVANLGAFLLLGAAFPLVVFSATAVRRMRRIGVQAPGPLMGFAGSVLAAGSLIVSALAAWTATQTAGLGDAGLSKALAVIWFAAGGVGFVAPFGLLVLGLAVPTLIMRLMPRPLAWAGFAVGVLGVLSSLGLLTDLVYPLIPVGRFGGLLFLVAVAVAMPTRARARRSVES